MRFLLTCLTLLVFSPGAWAWNAAGHRLSATIAWMQLSPASRKFIAEALERHPDFARWRTKARSDSPAAIFAEASTWPDDIRNDARFFDETQEGSTPRLSGFVEMGRHKRWHYIDLDAEGKVAEGELDRQIERLSRIVRTSRNPEEISYALPWLIHLVGDIHQPLHVGRRGDEGGNAVEIENPFNPRLSISSLHLYWDDLPGPPWLRGERLEKKAVRLIDANPPPAPGNIAMWRSESHTLLVAAYPLDSGSLLPVISENFHRQTSAVADRRIVDAGYRLGWLLEADIHARVSRETQ